MSDGMNSYKKGGTSKEVPPLSVIKEQRRSKMGTMKPQHHNENLSQQGNFENYSLHPNMQTNTNQQGIYHPRGSLPW